MVDCPRAGTNLGTIDFWGWMGRMRRALRRGIYSMRSGTGESAGSSARGIHTCRRLKPDQFPGQFYAGGGVFCEGVGAYLVGPALGYRCSAYHCLVSLP